MHNKKKRALSLALAATSVLSSTSIVAFAEDEQTSSPQAQAEVTVSSADDLKSQIESASAATTIKLGDNISLDATVSITNGKDITIDLNGHTITADNTGKAAWTNTTVFKNEGTLTFADSSDTKLGKVVRANTGKQYYLLANGKGGTLTIEGGTFTSADGWNVGSALIVNAANFGAGDTATMNITGGVIDTNNTGRITVIAIKNDDYCANRVVNISGGKIIAVPHDGENYDTQIATTGSAIINYGEANISGTAELYGCVWSCGYEGLDKDVTTNITGGTVKGYLRASDIDGKAFADSHTLGMNITGGTFELEAIVLGNFEYTEGVGTDFSKQVETGLNCSLEITDGDFNFKHATEEEADNFFINTNACEDITVSGGTFNAVPSYEVRKTLTNAEFVPVVVDGEIKYSTNANDESRTDKKLVSYNEKLVKVTVHGGGKDGADLEVEGGTLVPADAKIKVEQLVELDTEANELFTFGVTTYVESGDATDINPDDQGLYSAADGVVVNAAVYTTEVDMETDGKIVLSNTAVEGKRDEKCWGGNAETMVDVADLTGNTPEKVTAKTITVTNTDGWYGGRNSKANDNNWSNFDIVDNAVAIDVSDLADNNFKIGTYCNFGDETEFTYEVEYNKVTIEPEVAAKAAVTASKTDATVKEIEDAVAAAITELDVAEDYCTVTTKIADDKTTATVTFTITEAGKKFYTFADDKTTFTKDVAIEYGAETYAVTFPADVTVKAGDKALASGDKVTENTVLTITAAEKDGKTAVISVNGKELTGDTFKVGAGAVEITVEYTDVKTEYTVTIDSAIKNGKVTQTADNDGAVTLTVTPDKGYELDKLTVDGKVVEVKDGKYTFTPTANVTVTATFKEVKADEPGTTTPAADCYKIILTDDGHGKAASDAKDANKIEAGTVVTLTATPDKGYKFGKWTVVKGGVEVKDNKFTMPESDVEIKAEFERVLYGIKVTNDGHGTAKADAASAGEGDTVTLTATANSGYKFSKWTVVKGDVTIKDNKFTMPAGEVEIKAEFTKTSSSGSTSRPSGSSGRRPSSSSSTTETVTVNGKSGSWSDVTSTINSAANGSTITISGSTNIPADVIAAAAKKNIKLEVKVNDALTWVIDAAKVGEGSKYLSVSDSVINATNKTIKSGESSKDFRVTESKLGTGASLRYNAGKANSGKFANLFRVDGSNLVFVAVAKVDAAGNALLPITSAGAYKIVLSDETKLVGDLDNSMGLNALDAALMLKKLVNNEVTADEAAKFDFNGDGKTNALDAAAVLKWIVNQ